MAAMVPSDIATLIAKHGGVVEGNATGGVWWKDGRAVASWGNMVGKVDTAAPDGNCDMALEVMAMRRK